MGGLGGSPKARVFLVGVPLLAGSVMKRATLLGFDAAVNLLLGAALLTFPTRLVVLLGLPPTDVQFYPTLQHLKHWGFA